MKNATISDTWGSYLRKVDAISFLANVFSLARYSSYRFDFTEIYPAPFS